MKLVLLKWNQKIGGVQEAAAPKKFTYDANLAMNIYSLHRMRRKEPSIAHYKTDKANQVSIFSGFGEGGYGGTGGENYVGIPERVLSVTLDLNQNSRDYERIAVKIASRLFIHQEGLQDRLNAILSVIEKSGKEKDSKTLFKFLDSELDARLMFAPEDISLANRYEAQFCYHWITNLQEDLEEMTIRPASFAMADKTDYLQKLQEKEQIIQQLAQQVTSLSQGPREDQSADERLQQLQEDYQSIFLKLTEQVAESTEQFNNLQESMKGLIDDLNVSLREKMDEVRKLKDENATLRMAME
jgi:hypothetical protein